ncbi:cysteine hydrolase family protein [Sediminitomix flava]|uniref:Nicotinamidase-related amidase n=1 Tax=Sediminitomix flava TaxID=379075 RepID=A0A315Z536_SEDFL|nr:cysteine hydrolase family protein [Sediminitomix flava]PWJ38532.1 nicotinamidase-related amidase [Sediminitomix flava]
MKKALIIIDVQNDYFEGGIYPQFNTTSVLEPTKKAIEKAKQEGYLIVFIKHEAPEGFLVKGTEGSEIHAELKPYLEDGIIVTKTFANSFKETNLETVLKENNVTDLIITGIMTQNCVTHTAISKESEKYNVTVVGNACTAPNEMVHNVALVALTERVSVINSIEGYK